jgi:endonuclease/exonuclease/phosphatase family metal-dependent hydrolase
MTAAALHLGLSPGERREHARAIADRVRSFRQPVVLGGDLNEGPGEPASAWLADRLWDAFAVAGEGEGRTFPADDPQARIDYLFVTDGVGVAAAQVVAGADAASDHLPLLVDLELP